MLEIIVLGFVAFACAYIGILWFAGRKDDVIHGDFVDPRS
jgi:predicted RNase H-like nuclease